MWFRRGNGRREESKLSSGHWHKTEHVLGHFTWFNQDNKKQEWSTVNRSKLGQHRVLITVTQGLTLLSLKALLKSHHASFSHWMFFFPVGILSCSIRKVWQKRKCGVKFGCLTISHSTVRTHGPNLPPRIQILITVRLSMEICPNNPIRTVSVFRSIDPQPSWTCWPVRCGRTRRTGGPLTWSLVGSLLMFDP